MIITDIFESHQQCPECGGPAFSDLILAEKKDACYYKVKASAKVWPSAYASGRLVQCRKKGADNYGKSKNEGVAEMDSQQPTGRIKPDGTRSHSTYGSRDHYNLGDPETTLGLDSMLPAKDVAKKASQTLNKVFGKSHKKGVAEGTQTVGHEILGMLRQVRRQGHDAMEELYSSCPLLAQFWDQYEGDFRSMVIELSPKTLNRIKAEIAAFNQQGVAEGSLNEFVLPGGGGGDNYGGDLHDILMAYISRNEPELLADFGEDEIDSVVADMVTMGMFDDIDPDNEEDLEDALDKIIDILNDDLPEQQGVAEGTGNGYYYLQGGIERSKKFASEAEAMAHSKRFFQLARVRRVTLKYKEPGQPAVVVKEFSFGTPPPKPSKPQMSWGDFYLQGKKQGMAEGKPNQLPTKGADYSQYDTDHLRTLLKPGILHRNEARFKALIRKELQKREQQSVAEAINPDITNPAFSHQQQIGDYLYVARYWSKGLKISAYDGNKLIGRADLMYHSGWDEPSENPKYGNPKKFWLESEITEVNPKYQRQGIMSNMYAYAKMLGNSVKPSEFRSDDAQAAWKSWRQAGDAKHLTSNEGVAEGNDEKIGGRYDPDEFDAMVSRLKKLAGAGPMKTVYDPQKRVYRNVPVAQQPSKK